MTVEKFVTALGITVSVYCINHGSLALAIQWPESGRTCTIWVDPVANYYGNTVDYSSVPAADVLLITHAHGDHLDKALAEEAIRGGALCLGSEEVAATLREASALPHHAPVKVAEGITVTAVPAYNQSPGHLKFHPQSRKDNGYVIDIEGYRIYVAGDTEDIPEMENLKGSIDLAFLPVNQPYTMTIPQAVHAARMIAPKSLIPYHLTDTDLTLLENSLKAALPEADLRIVPEFR